MCGSGFAIFLAVIDIAHIVYTAPSIWTGIGDAQDKWFNPFNIVHFVAEMIFLSPAIGAFMWREKLKERE